METFCLVLTGHLTTPVDDATLSRLAAAFGMGSAEFREKVWRRAPLVIRQSLNAESAKVQVQRLESLGAVGEAMPEETALIWLSRDGLTLGPLPASTLDHYAAAGDRWCHDGGDWQPWATAPAPPPLPASSQPAMPPPLPVVASKRRRVAAWIGGAVALALLAWLWVGQRKPTAVDPVAAVRYVPRPLQAMPAATPPATPCPATGVSASSDEDRFLVAGGERELTGRSQRMGETYVAEAILARDADCQPSAVQLYVFRHGVFVGTPLDSPVDPRHTQLVSFNLVDDRQLLYNLRSCEAQAARCARDDSYRALLQPGNGGWALTYGVAGADASVEIISRSPPHYPAAAMRERHEGTVVLALTVGLDGQPSDISVSQSSGYAELDQAALESARRWRFRALRQDGSPTTARTQVPVRFHLDS